MEKFIKLKTTYVDTDKTEDVIINLRNIMAIEVSIEGKCAITTSSKSKNEKFLAYVVDDTMAEIEEKLKKINAI